MSTDDIFDDDGISPEKHTGEFDRIIDEGSKKYKLPGMYKEWFLDYASYVILERAVPHIADGLKPVQRRILHAMKTIDDGRFIKVASISGATMPFHPHGNVPIEDALVQIGQKDLLIDCQGNWGNILTGDPAAAARYIEARLSKFANEVLFNPKLTEWVNSYDGRSKEPVHLPVKFPILLAQGSEGIAVGLACKILPHNFNEILDASIAYLKGEDFVLEPDFPTGGYADTSSYNRGIRGGRVRVRAEIRKLNKNTLVITEIPFGKNTGDIMDSIIKANDRGKIRIKKIDDNTAEHAEIIIQLHNDVSPDRTIDALYAFTDCEVSISPNTCVIRDHQPVSIGVDEILKYSTDNTMSLFKREFEIRLGELENEWHYSSLEKIFFENKVYKVLENDAKTWERQLDDILEAMNAYRPLLRKDITKDDILKLVDRPVKKISKFDIKAINEKIKDIENKEKQIKYNITHLVDFCIGYFNGLKEKYGDRYPRKTKITSFENIEVVKVVANNAKLYVNRSEGFIGTSAKKIEEAEYVCDCSDMDEVLIFLKDGRYTVRKISDKLFVERNIIYVGIFRRADARTVYNIAYRDGKNGFTYVKRFSITGLTRDKWYTATQGKDGSVLYWFSANHNGEAETIKVFLKARPMLKKLIFEFDFAKLAIKGRNSVGNILTKNPVQKIQLRSAGVSTLEAKQLWFDWDINRLNEDGRGEPLGGFKGGEHILALCRDGSYYTTGIDLSTRFQGDLLRICRFVPEKTYTAIYMDSESKCHIKRFAFELSENTVRKFIPEEPGTTLSAISDDMRPVAFIEFVQEDGKKAREPMTVDVEQFIGIKGLKAKGKRVSPYPAINAEFKEALPVPGDGKDEAETAATEDTGESAAGNDDEPTLF